jgi:hypothetical protein
MFNSGILCNILDEKFSKLCKIIMTTKINTFVCENILRDLLSSNVDEAKVTSFQLTRDIMTDSDKVVLIMQENACYVAKIIEYMINQTNLNNYIKAVKVSVKAGEDYNLQGDGTILMSINSCYIVTVSYVVSGVPSVSEYITRHCPKKL